MFTRPLIYRSVAKAMERRRQFTNSLSGLFCGYLRPFLSLRPLLLRSGLSERKGVAISSNNYHLRGANWFSPAVISVSLLLSAAICGLLSPRYSLLSTRYSLLATLFAQEIDVKTKIKELKHNPNSSIRNSPIGSPSRGRAGLTQPTILWAVLRTKIASQLQFSGKDPAVRILANQTLWKVHLERVHLER